MYIYIHIYVIKDGSTNGRYAIVQTTMPSQTLHTSQGDMVDAYHRDDPGPLLLLLYYSQA